MKFCTITGVCSYVQKHVIEALQGFSKFSANEVSKVRNIEFVIVFIFGSKNCNVVLLDTGVCSYVQKHVIEALQGFSKFSANEVSKVRNIEFVIVFIFGSKNCNVVLLDASTANICSNSLAPVAVADLGGGGCFGCFSTPS